MKRKNLKSLDKILFENSRRKIEEGHQTHIVNDHHVNTQKKVKQRIISWIFLLPSLIGVLLFFGAPFAVVIYYSFISNPIQHLFVGTANYYWVLRNAAFRMAAFNTLRFSAIAVPLAVVLSLMLAMVLESSIPGKSAFRSMFLSPMMVPIASVVLIWQVLFHYNGLTNRVLNVAFGFTKIDWLKSKYAPIVIVILFLWKNLGYNMILFMAALSSVPVELLEAARLEKANRWQIFWSIKIHYLASTIMFVSLMSLINSFKTFREIYLMTGGYPYESLYMLQHYMNNKFNKLDYQDLSAAAILMAGVVIVVVAVLFYIEGRVGKDVENG